MTTYIRLKNRETKSQNLSLRERKGERAEINRVKDAGQEPARQGSAKFRHKEAVGAACVSAALRTRPLPGSDQSGRPLPRFTSGRTQAPHLPSPSARRPVQESDPGQRRMPRSSHPKWEKKKKKSGRQIGSFNCHEAERIPGARGFGSVLFEYARGLCPPSLREVAEEKRGTTGPFGYLETKFWLEFNTYKKSRQKHSSPRKRTSFLSQCAPQAPGAKTPLKDELRQAAPAFGEAAAEPEAPASRAGQRGSRTVRSSS